MAAGPNRKFTASQSFVLYNPLKLELLDAIDGEAALAIATSDEGLYKV